MMHTYQPVTHVAFTQEKADHSLLWALLASMLLHIVIAYVYPQFKSKTLPPPTSIQVLLNQLPKETTPVPAQPPAPPMEQPETPKVIPPKPVTKTPKVERPVMVTTTPVLEQSYQVPVEQKSETPSTPVNPTSSSASNTSTTPAQPTTEQTTVSAAQQPTTARSSEEVTSDEVWDGYGKALASMVNKLKQYPTIAIRRHLEGEVKVIASFKQGKLVSLELAHASQHPVLNEEALRTIRKAIEQVALNANLEHKTFTVMIPVGFKLE